MLLSFPPFLSFQTQHIFKHVFDKNTGQKEVFDRLGFPLVEDLLQGKNGENTAPSSLYLPGLVDGNTRVVYRLLIQDRQTLNCGAVVQELFIDSHTEQILHKDCM